MGLWPFAVELVPGFWEFDEYVDNGEFICENDEWMTGTGWWNERWLSDVFNVGNLDEVVLSC